MRLTLIVVGLLGLPPGVLAGTTYRFETVYDGSFQISGRVWVDGTLARREYDLAPRYPYDVEIAREGEPERIGLNLTRRTFGQIPLSRGPRLSTLRLPILLDKKEVAASEVTVSVDQAPSLESWGPHRVRHVTLSVSYTLSRSETGQPVRARIVAKGEFWVTDALGVERLGFGDGNVSLRTGHTEVDAVVTEHLQGVKGLALKTVVTATRTMAEREPATETMSRTLSDFEDVPVAAARFEVPEGYRNVGMMVMPVIPAVPAVALLPTQRAMPYAGGRPRPPVTPLAEGAPAPAGISFVTPEGKTVGLEDLRGKVVMVSFWATWCGPCMKAIPELVRLQKRFADDPFVIVGVNVDPERGTLTRFVAAQKIPWPQCWDGDHKVTRSLFGVDGFPTEILLDHKGVVVSRSTGWGRGFGDRLARRVLDALDTARKAREKSRATPPSPKH